MFASPGGMPNAAPVQMMGQPQPGYFPPGSNIASPPGPPGSGNLSSSGFTSPPYAVDFSTPQSSGGTQVHQVGISHIILHQQDHHLVHQERCSQLTVQIHLQSSFHLH